MANKDTDGTIGGEFRLTVKELRDLLEGEPDDAVVVVSGCPGSGEYFSCSLYKTACAADDSILYLYAGSDWPKE